KLGEDADFLKAREFSILDKVLRLLRAPRSSQGTNKTALERSAAAVVFANRAVHLVAGSRLVDVTYSDPVPTRAQKVATAFAEAFIDSTIDKRFLANAYAKTFLEDQIKQLKLRLEESEQEAL